MTEKHFILEGSDPAIFFGPGNANLRMLRALLPKMRIMARDNVIWQTGELGKVDAGGGGTVAKYVSKMNVDTVDIGVPVISMHAPYELISKADLYETHKAFLAFCED